MADTDSKESSESAKKFIPSNRLCSWCIKPSPSVKRCGQCKMVQYCSKTCQKAAWKFHKKACMTGANHQRDVAENEETAELNYELNKWLKFWRMYIHNLGVQVMDLANHPPDRLATHVWVLILDRDYETNLQSFRMKCDRAEIWTREEATQYMRDTGASEENISDWYDDNRGDHTLHTAIFVGSYVRFMWISFRTLDDYRNKTPEESRRIAKETKEKLMYLINNPPL
ncbi:hypothetical protein QCA50_011543 [Cerrena zonata]|uniref:MYND-type domain-containing protein n=1 Tax=Cerrena zonata TaxID=2478898 RepID=A0AAW0G847_9APHY